ncbi:hypothetical protein [Kingella oralis]|uniref:hypothetical protein n=1 Tax=Kingella oralis TaxID=505 RepID=UPI0034E52F55
MQNGNRWRIGGSPTFWRTRDAMFNKRWRRATAVPFCFSGCLNAGGMLRQPENCIRAFYGLLASRALAKNFQAACCNE